LNQASYTMVKQKLNVKIVALLTGVKKLSDEVLEWLSEARYKC